MISHATIAAHLAAIADADLHAFAVQVTYWRRMLYHDAEYNAEPQMVIRLLAGVSSAFGDRQWNNGYHSRSCAPPGSRWAKVHADADHLVQKAVAKGETALLIRHEVRKCCAELGKGAV